MKTPIIASLACLLSLAACGGGGGGGGGGSSTPPPPPPPPAAPESPAGLWTGTTNTGRSVSGIVLDTNEYWLIYSVAGNDAVAAGIVQGNATVSGNQLTSSNLRDFNFEGAGVLTGSLDATFSQGKTLDGNTSYDQTGPTTFSATFDSNYNVAPTLAAVAGAYEGQFATAAGASYGVASISSDGQVSAAGSGCSSSGTIKPHATGNVYDVLLTFGEAPCALPGVTVSGVAYLDPESGTLYVGLIDSSRENGALFIGTK